MFKDCPRWSRDDDYMTQKSAWEEIAGFLPRGKTIWECFWGDGKSGEYLRELGFEVIHEPVDFFENDLGEIFCSNPPYSCKKEVFTRLKELQKPFVMLVPTSTLHTKYFKDLFSDAKIQLIIPAKKRQFDNLNKEHKPNGCSFHTCYVCYGIDLVRDVIFI